MSIVKHKRLKAYKECYAEIMEGGYHLHLCGRLRNWVYVTTGDYLSVSDMPKLFPEFAQFQPEVYEFGTTQWYAYDEVGKSERLACLAFCIAMVEKGN